MIMIVLLIQYQTFVYDDSSLNVYDNDSYLNTV